MFSPTLFQTQEIRDIGDPLLGVPKPWKNSTAGSASITRITAVKEGQPFDAHADVIRQSDNKGMGGKNTWYQKKPAEYKLVPGTYTLKVTDRSLTPFQTQEIRDIEILSGQTVEKTVSFVAGGVLKTPPPEMVSPSRPRPLCIVRGTTRV